MVCKLVLALVLLLREMLVHGEPGIDFVLTHSGLRGFVNQAITEAVDEIMLNGIPIFKQLNLNSEGHYLLFSNIKISDVNLPASTVTMIKGKGFKVDVHGTSFHMISDWIYEKRLRPTIYNKGSVSISFRGMNVSLNVEIVEGIDQSAIRLVSCSVSIGEISADFGKNSPLNNIVRKSIRDRLKVGFEEDICGEVAKTMNDVIRKKLEFLTPFMYGPFFLDYNLNRTIVVTENSIKAFLNGRFAGDSARLKDIKMEAPADGMFGLAISEEVLNSAMRVWYNETPAEFSFVRNLEEFEYVLPYDWIDTSEPLLFTVHVPELPSVTISSNGILATMIGSVEISPVNPEPDSNHPINVTFSGSVLFNISLSWDYQSLKLSLKDFDLKALSSPDPEFNLDELDELIAYYKKLYLKHIRKDFVVLIPLFRKHYFSSKTAKLTIQDRFFQVSGELDHF